MAVPITSNRSAWGHPNSATVFTLLWGYGS